MTDSNNKHLLEEEAKAFASSGRINYYDIVIDHGKGAVITDADGNDYIDLLASASSTNTGHAHPKVVKAIQDQAAKLIQYTPAYFANTQEARLAPRLAKLAPMSGPVEVSWGLSGSDANDAIIKFARAYTGRQYLVAFTGAYHGSTYGSMSLSSISMNMSRKMAPLLPGVVKVPFPSPWEREPNESEEHFVDRFFREFMRPFETYLPAEETAVILMEAIQGDGGICKTPPAFMKKVYDFAKAHGILFAVDEINQGMGRTGKWWSIQNFDGIEPDLMSVGKSLASGLPLSAVVGRQHIYLRRPAIQLPRQLPTQRWMFLKKSICWNAQLSWGKKPRHSLRPKKKNSTSLAMCGCMVLTVGSISLIRQLVKATLMPRLN